MERARTRAAAMIDGLVVVDSAMGALDDADAAALITEWAEFTGLDWDAAAGVMRQALIVDGRNSLPPDVLARAGFTYVGFGRGRLDPEEVTSAVPALAHAGGGGRADCRRHRARSDRARRSSANMMTTAIVALIAEVLVGWSVATGQYSARAGRGRPRCRLDRPRADSRWETGAPRRRGGSVESQPGRLGRRPS